MKITEITQGEKDLIASAIKMCGSMAFNTAEGHGFWKRDHLTNELEPRNKAEMHMLMVTEIAEMTEAIRRPCKDQHIPIYNSETVEAVDLFIRLMDYIEAHGILNEFCEALFAKMEYNEGRPFKHGKNF